MVPLEQWKMWKPLEELNGQYYIKSIETGFEGFSIILNSSSAIKPSIKIFFDSSPDAYQKTNKKYRTKTLNYLKETYGETFCANWTFFKVEKSSYLQWIRKEACGSADERPFIHFAFITPDLILDIIDVGEPEVTFINLPEQTT